MVLVSAAAELSPLVPAILQFSLVVEWNHCSLAQRLPDPYLTLLRLANQDSRPYNSRPVGHLIAYGANNLLFSLCCHVISDKVPGK